MFTEKALSTMTVFCRTLQLFLFVCSKKEPKESSSKIKALNDTILRMNEKNVRLTSENKSLKEDLDKLMAQLADTKEKKC